MFSPEEYFEKSKEKKRIRKAANAVGVACVLTTAANYVLSLILGAVLRLTNSLELINDPVFISVFQIFASVIMFVPVFLATARIMGIKVSRACSFSGVKEKGLIFPSLATGYGVCVIASITGGIISAFLKSIGLESEVDFPLPDGVLGFFIAAIAFAVIPALVEEFAFRGVVLSLFKPYGDGFAIAVSGIMFGLIHGNMAQIPFAVIVGIALGYITVRTGSVWVAVGLHFINNFVSMLLDYLMNKINLIPEEMISAVWLFATVIFAISGVLILNSRGKKLIEIKDANTFLTKKEKYKSVFSSPGVIFAIIVIALEVAVNMKL